MVFDDLNSVSEGAKEKGFDQREQMAELSASIDKNIATFKRIFKDDNAIIYRDITNKQNPEVRFCAIYADGMVNNKIINDDIVLPLINAQINESELNTSYLRDEIIGINDVKLETEVKKLCGGIIYGDTIILIEGIAQSMICNSKGFSMRSVSEPEGEKVLFGPREGFVENLMTNTTLLRRKVRSPRLKFLFTSIGNMTSTQICVSYIEGLVNEDVLKEVNKELEKIDIDGILDVNYIEELMVQSGTKSPFRVCGRTEKPDVVAAKLLEGRIALFVDGTPVALTVPHVFVENFQSPDDYYESFYMGTFSRLIRVLCFFLTISVPAIYIALITYHQEMLPTQLLISISAARQDVPIPTVLEAIVLLLFFEILREAGARIPAIFGQTVSIVGALILGQAAVQAKLVSATMLIVVALAGIAGLISSRIKGAIIVIRFALLILASMFGIYGYIFGMTALLIYLVQLNSFNVDYLSGIEIKHANDFKDSFIRAVWSDMRSRPSFLSKNNEKRQAWKKEGQRE